MYKTNLNEGHAGMFNSKSVQPMLLNDSSNSAKYKNGVWQNRIASKGLQRVSPTETTFTKLGYYFPHWEVAVFCKQSSDFMEGPKAQVEGTGSQRSTVEWLHESWNTD